MKHLPLPNSKAGFSLVELLLSLVLSSLVALGVFSMYVLNQNAWAITTLNINSSSEASAALERIVYGAGGPSLRSQDDGDVTLTVDPYGSGAWQLDYASNTLWVAYDPVAGTLGNQAGQVLCSDITACSASLTNNGVLIDLTVSDSGGLHTSTSTMSSFVRFRN